MPARLYEDTVETLPCSSQGIGTLSRLGSEPASVQNADGSVSEGVWHWWTSDSCPDPQAVKAREQMQAGRVARGLDPLPDCPTPDVPGKTCQRKFYPERTLYPDGSFREQSWSWQAGASGRDQFGMVQNWDVQFTPEEARIYASLQSEDYLRSLDARAVLAVYYSLLNWKCIGKVGAVLEPSPVSPQSLAKRYDSGSQFWLEFWERGLRDRIWMVRPDLRQVRLPDGRLETGLQPPADISRPPSCTTQTGQILSYVVGALTLYASVPTWITTVMSLPDTLLSFRDMLKTMGRASEIQRALLGTPSPVEQALDARASGQTKSPTEAAGAVSGASGVPWWLLAAGAAALLS